MARKFLPRLSKADVEALFRAHNFIDQAVKLLMTTNAQAAAAAIPLIGNADQVICALWNKTEKALLAGSTPESTPSAEDAPAEISAPVAQENAQNASPGAPGAPESGDLKP